jgi:hypothetical protein
MASPLLFCTIKLEYEYFCTKCQEKNHHIKLRRREKEDRFAREMEEGRWRKKDPIGSVAPLLSEAIFHQSFSRITGRQKKLDLVNPACPTCPVKSFCVRASWANLLLIIAIHI